MDQENYALTEREALCDLLLRLGPDQPTLCDGWLTRDLAAHLLLRERHPLAATGIVLRPVAGYTTRVQERYADQPFENLLAALRRPPRWSPARLAAVDRAMNTVEMFIHHEDVRRGQVDWQPRQLPEPLGRTLMARVGAFARLRLRRFPAAVVIEAPGFGEIRVGADGEKVRVTGEPGELAMFLSGRQRAARVDLAGPEKLTAKLSRARLGG